MKETEIIWHNGKYMPWHEATTHILSHALHYGSSVFISSGNRVAQNTIPAGVKAGGNYLSSQLISMEAHRLGYDQGIGRRGPMTERIQSAFFGLFNGQTEDLFGWLEPIDGIKATKQEVSGVCA